MKFRAILPFAVVFSFTVVACASSGGDSTRASFQRNIGTASGPDTMDRMVKVLREFHFEVQREETTPEIMIETRWRERLPFQDERESGITSAENRIIVTGRVRNITQLGANYAIDMAIDNRVRLAASPDWVETSASRMYRAYADSIVKVMQRELTIGVRRY